MPTVREIEQALFALAPKETAEGWDNVGHLVGDPEREVERVLVALDITEAVADEAIAKGCQLIVAHHPVIWGQIGSVTDESLTGQKLLTLIENGIAAICAHTNLDAAEGGVNTELARRIGLLSPVPLETEGEDETGVPYGIGRVGLLEGGTMTLADFAARVKELGFALKLDSNGSRPAVLRELVEKELVDYVAMDIKSSRENYGKLVGIAGFDTAAVEESTAYLMEGHVDFEFRTTVVKGLHSAEDFVRIGQWLQGGEKYFLQSFKDSGDILGGVFSACSPDEMHAMRAAVLPYIPNTSLRGAD